VSARVDVLGVGFDRVDLAAAVERTLRRLDAGERTFVITANPEFVMLARRDESLARIARDADLVVPDGSGIVAASRLLGDRLPRVPGRLFVDALVPHLAQRHSPITTGAAMSREAYEVYAVKYATRDGTRSANFIGGDPHDGPMPMDYFVWVAKGGGRTFVIDTGFNAEVSEKRKRTFLRCPVEALAALGIDANAVEDVILTHLHYDHVGNFDRFPKARFHLQERELAYATGRYMHYPRLSHSFEVEDVCGIVRLNYAGRVMFYNGDAELAPGLTMHAVGGHSAGLQFVRVKTRRGFVVLASDVTHFYENMASSRPFTTAFHIGEMLEGFDRLLALAPDEGHIVPGHDPLVMKLYPAPSPELEGVAVRLDVPPSGVAPSRADYSFHH